MYFANSAFSPSRCAVRFWTLELKIDFAFMVGVEPNNYKYQGHRGHFSRSVLLPVIDWIELCFHASGISTEQEVRFTTGIDSLSFVASPGETHNLMVELSDGERCRIAIVAPPTPPLLANGRGILVVAGFAAVALLAYWPRRVIPLATLLSCGWIAPLSFWALTIVGGFIHGHYNHLRMVVSELGAIDARSELFMSIGEVFVGVTCLLFSAGIHRASRERGLNILPALCTLAMPVSMAWAAVFPMHHELHGALGPLPLLLNVGALLAFLFWRRPDVVSLGWLSLAAFGLMGLIFLRFVAGIQS